MRLAGTLVTLCAVLGLNQGLSPHPPTPPSTWTSSLPPLLFANRRDIQLVQQWPPSSAPGGGGRGAGGANATILVSDLEDAAAMDFLYGQSSGAGDEPEPTLIFWADVSQEVISSIALDPANPTVLNPKAKITHVAETGLLAPDGLACDWLGRKLYWADSETNRIEVAELDGKRRKVLIWDDLDQPRAIALDPLRGYMYWTDWGEIPKIERAGMDGAVETREVLIKEEIHWPNGLTLDYEEERMYWADAKKLFIHSAKLDGTDRIIVIEGTLPHPFALTLFQDRLYWTDWETRSIHSCNKTTGKNNKTVLTHIYSPMDIHAFSALRQPRGTSPCGVDNGGCSDLCLMSPLPPRYSCACPTGVKLQGDKKTCANGAEQLLLLARRQDLRRISLDTPDYTDVVLPLTNPAPRHAIAIAYDVRGDGNGEGYVYWTDDEQRLIWKARADGTGQEQVISGEVMHPDGVAVDWVARNLYWTDTGTDRIEVSRLNGTSRRVLISEGLEEPRAIVVDPVAGLMYWTDWGEKPKIERSNLDGTDRRVFVNTSLGWPNGLALDYEEKKIYWADARTDKIEVANLDGTERRTLVSEMCPHIFGLSLLGDFIYWTDWQKRSIERVNKRTGMGREIIIEQLPDLMGLCAVNVNDKTGWNPCADHNWGCSHLCLYRPTGPVCACPMGLELLADAKTCIVPEAFLLFSRRKDIHRISLEINNNDVVIPISGVMGASALDFDINDNRIYWTDTELRKISRAFMNGSAHESVVLFGLNNPEGMAVDWVAHNLYWGDSGTHRIEMARLDGTSRKVLVWRNISEPRSIALDPQRGRMYWSDWKKNTLERAQLDGTLRKTLLSDCGRLNSLTIDYTDERLYWTDIDQQRIKFSNLDGREIRDLYQKPPFNPHSLTQYGDFIYWTDWQAMSIERVNKTTGENRTRIQGQQEYIMDILVFHASRQQGWNSCGVDNGGCSHLCIAYSLEGGGANVNGGGGGAAAAIEVVAGNASHRCSCPTHYKLKPDGKTCQAAESFLLFSQKTSISRMVFDAAETESAAVDVNRNEMNVNVDADAYIDVVLPVDNLRNIKAISYDVRDRYIYWVDGKTKTIKRAKDDGRNVTVVVPNPKMLVHQPYDIAVDPYARRLYWSDARNDVINVTRLDGDELWPIGVVVSGEGGQQPRKIALAPKDGYIFWTNGARSPKIERADMDGLNHLTLYATEISSLDALTVDPYTKTIYWADIELGRIEYGHFDGRDRKVLCKETLLEFKGQTGLAVFEEYLYWVDREMKNIKRVHKTECRAPTEIKSRIGSLSDIHAVIKLSQEEIDAHPCSGENGGCSHLCVAKEKEGRRCSCPMDLVLAEDARKCMEPPTCNALEFTCNSGECVPLAFQCDGTPDCKDRSDEEQDECVKCKLKCSNGECMIPEMRCNGLEECSDGSDEEACAPCNSNMYGCESDGRCIIIQQQCNGYEDCPGGDDERDCGNRPNGAPQYYTGQTWKIIIAVAVIVAIIIMVVIIAVVRHTCKPMQGLGDSQDVFNVSKPLASCGNYPSNNSTPPNTLLPRGKSSGATAMTLYTSTNGASSTGVNSALLQYDRAHVTGASASASSSGASTRMTSSRYPYDPDASTPLNPPPSLITDVASVASLSTTYSHGAASSSMPSMASASLLRKPHHHRYHHHHRGHHHHHHRIPPLPTPCSTDVCEDSEEAYDDDDNHAAVGGGGHNKYYNPGIDYDSDALPFAIPPCPSPYFSEDCPPSPLTEHSFNPYPPPPSPVGTSEC